MDILLSIVAIVGWLLAIVLSLKVYGQKLDLKNQEAEIKDNEDKMMMLHDIMRDPEKLKHYLDFIDSAFAIVEEARKKYGAEYATDGKDNLLLALQEFGLAETEDTTGDHE